MSTTTKADRRERRIATLRAIIERKTTGDGERSNAARALARLLNGQAKTDGGESGWNLYNRWYGDKYHLTTGKTLTEIAKMIRADLALARKLAKTTPAVPGDIAVIDPIGDAPDQITFSVRTSYYSGGGSIEITVKNIPDLWGFTTVTDDWGHERAMPTDALRALAKELKAVSNAYNHDGSEPQIDYFDRRFYGGVSTEDGLSIA